MNYYWEPIPELMERIRPLATGLVVDVGAGHHPFPWATELVDRKRHPLMKEKPCHILDLNCDRLPYKDKSVSFLFCRHTLEDLHYPLPLLREINRVACAGYIECPSVMNEWCRGTSGPENFCRGYGHHWWFTWTEDDTFWMLPKYPMVEYTSDPQADTERMLGALSADPWLWNTYYLWEGECRFRLDYDRTPFTCDMGKVFEELIDHGQRESLAFKERMK